MVFELFRWWYGEGWLQTAKSVNNWTTAVRLTFSLPLLIKTLFSPWRRIITIPGRSLDAKMRAIVDNLVSRVVGFVTRLMVLIAALGLLAVAAVTAVVATVVWPLVPVLIVFCIFKGIVG